jgi:hypothetical protein
LRALVGEIAIGKAVRLENRFQLIAFLVLDFRQVLAIGVGFDSRMVKKFDRFEKTLLAASTGLFRLPETEILAMVRRGRL